MSRLRAKRPDLIKGKLKEKEKKKMPKEVKHKYKIVNEYYHKSKQRLI